MTNSDRTAELRDKIIALTLSCPKGMIVVDCPFRMLQELCHGTKMNTLRQMDYDALLKLFAYSSNCSCPADPRKSSNEFQDPGSDI